MLRHFARAALAAVMVLGSGCASGYMGTMMGSDDPPAPVLWKFEAVYWYNRYSMNSTVGPLIVGASVLYGGTYAYGDAKASKLALVDPATGTARWRMDYGAAFGPLALERGMIVVTAGDSVLGLELESGIQRWTVQAQPRSLTAAAGVVLVAERETIRALDIASGAQRWQAASSTDPVAAGDTVIFMDGQFLRAVAADDGIGRWTLELPAPLAYPQSLLGDHLYILGAASLGSVNIKTRALEWVAQIGSAPTGGMVGADDTLYFTTQTPSGSYVFHAFDPATQKDRWSRPLESSARVAPVVMGSLVATAANSSAQSLVALSRSAGTVAWSAGAGSSVPVQPLLKGNVLYVAGQGPNRVYAFAADTGAALWSGRLWGWPMGMALTDDGTLLVSADNLTLYAYRGTGQ
ncbi:MAG TPA: PQQ-binding-like beta-propeller repeat protein [Methylomirabilota bacterium]